VSDTLATEPSGTSASTTAHGERMDARLTDPVMQKLNAKVDGAGEDISIVARSWPVDEGFVKP
jgi:glycine betaine/choline ABC-type transport system substrate-binding protein